MLFSDDICQKKMGNISDMPRTATSLTPVSRKAGVDIAVRQLLHRSAPGKVFTPADFLHLGSRAAVDQALSRLVRQGAIRRLSRGLYDKPREHEILGELLPETPRIAEALAEKSKLRLQPSGAYAANLLGLSEQVPLKLTFLTDGPSRIVKVGRQAVVLKHTTPKNMVTAGRISGHLIQALRYMKKTQMDVTAISRLSHTLTESDKRILLQDAYLAPAWIGKIMRKLGEGQEIE
jgi:hypothetical protein